MKILVGMSGGVDSSVTALMLKEQGHEVIGATMSIWGKKEIHKKIQEKLASMSGNKPTHAACYGPDKIQDIEETKKIAASIGIPLYVFDCAEQYEEIVLENFKKEYLNGRTPNPCILCNSLIKFDILPKMALANGIQFDKFATGHYARVEKTGERYILKRGLSENKDQSYFLYRLKQEQLSKILMPLGTYTKEEIRSIAEKHGLKVFDKPDSQDFYAGDYNELLEVKPKKGNIVDKTGKILGTHDGIWNYTIGQRKGLGISASEPLYVLELRKETNEVVVGGRDDTMKDSLTACDLNWIPFDKLTKEIKCLAKIRSTQKPTEVTVTPQQDGKVFVKFENLQKSIAIGQSVVFYDDDILLGGGIIDS